WFAGVGAEDGIRGPFTPSGSVEANAGQIALRIGTGRGTSAPKRDGRRVERPLEPLPDARPSARPNAHVQRRVEEPAVQAPPAGRPEAKFRAPDVRVARVSVETEGD